MAPLWHIAALLLLCLGVCALAGMVAWIVATSVVERGPEPHDVEPDDLDEHARQAMALLDPDALDRQDLDEVDRQWSGVDLWMRDMDPHLTPVERAEQIARLEAGWTS